MTNNSINPEEHTSYTYSFADGTAVTLHVGDIDSNGEVVTAEMIELLHRFDTKEMYNNRKNTRTPVAEWEKPGLEYWQSKHPGEYPPSRYHVPLDAITENDDGDDDDYDKGNLAQASLIADSNDDDEIPSPNIARLHEIVSTMKPELQETYRMLVLEGMSTSEIAELLGVTNRAVRKRRSKIKKIIRENF